MKPKIPPGYQADMADIAAGLNDLMADLEDIRDDVMEAMENGQNDKIHADLKKIDAAMALLAQAASLLEDE